MKTEGRMSSEREIENAVKSCNTIQLMIGKGTGEQTSNGHFSCSNLSRLTQVVLSFRFDSKTTGRFENTMRCHRRNYTKGNQRGRGKHGILYTSESLG